MAMVDTKRSDPIFAAAALPMKARPILLAPHISGANAFRHIVQACLTHLAQNEPAAIAGIDDEGVHQARIAIRRLRSALVLFQDYAGAKMALGFRARLRDANQMLGEARDWDVFLSETVRRFIADCRAVSPASIVKVADRLHGVAHRNVRAVLTDPGHRTLLAEIEAWINDESWRSGLGLHAFRRLDEPCRDLAGPLLDEVAGKVAKRGRDIADHTAEERHALRKAMKKLRYGAEFLASLYPKTEVRRYLKPAERLQDILGQLNDAAATGSLLDRLAVENGRNLPELDAFRDWVKAGAPGELRSLHRAWAAFEKAKPFWK